MSSSQFPIELNAGQHTRIHCPVTFGHREPIESGAGLLVDENGRSIPAQAAEDGSISFVIDELEALNSRRFRYEPYPGSDEGATDVMKAVDDGSGNMALLRDRRLITEYHYSSDYARPFFFPVNEPGGQCVTRSYPMRTEPNETSDHPHHKSMWIAHGDVNSVDNWSEEPGHGFTRHLSTDEVTSGPVFARFQTTSEWRSRDEQPLLTQFLSVTAWTGDETSHMVDIEIELSADQRDEDIVFGDTKEGGILSVRVASALDGTRGGSMRNVYGGKQEAECWGKPSHWCSYSGHAVQRPCGIAVFDHPDGFRSPTTWHVRDYGLMTANPFGLAAFTNGRLNGEYVLRHGASMRFKYRVVTHSDPHFQVKCSPRYIDFAFPPRVKCH